MSTSLLAALAPQALNARTRTTKTPRGAGAEKVVVPAGTSVENGASMPKGFPSTR